MTDLSNEHVRPGERLSDAEQEALLVALPGWCIVPRDGIPQLEKRFRFADFRQALAFTNAVGELAEAADHHPAILTEWGSVTLRWWSHSLKGLQRADFVMAARSDARQSE